MRSFIRVAAAAALLIPIAGCGDDGGADTDASVTADAAVADAGPDAAPAADAAPDATPDAAPPGAVTITILDPADQGVAGIDLVFSNADGSLISHQLTDAAGQATETVPGDAMISLALMDGGSRVLYTIGHVQPGDAIVFSDFGAPGAMQPTVHGTAAVTLPGEFTDAEGYRVTEGCNTEDVAVPTADTDLEVSSACVDGSDQFDVVAQALVAGQFSTETALAHSYLLDQTLPGANDSLTLPAWSEQFTEVTVSTMNLPGGALGIFGESVFFLDGAEFDIADDTVALGGGDFIGLVPEGITPTATQPTAVVLFGSGTTLTGFGVVTTNVAGLPTTVEVDFAASLPRGATSGTFDTTTDPARPVVNWNATGSDSVTDLTQVQLFWTEGNESHNWNLVTRPAENGPVQLPEMPTALEAFSPTASSTYDGVQANYIGASWITEDWPTLRQQAGISAAEQPAVGSTLAASTAIFADSAAALVRPAIAAKLKQVQVR